jgi:hypothetical protein
MEALLFRVTRSDPIVVGATVLALVGSGVAASMVPALRAARVSPLVAIKEMA